MNRNLFTTRSARSMGMVATLAFSLCSGGAFAQRAGQADPNFGENGNGLQIITHDSLFLTFAAVAAPDGRTYAAGVKESKPALLRLESNGQPDIGFGVITYQTPDIYTSGSFNDVQMLHDGSIVAAGTLSAAFGDVGIVCKIESSGVADVMFSSDSAMPGCLLIDRLLDAQSISVRTDGALIVSGRSTYLDSGSLAIVRVSKNGDLDNSFAQGAGVATPPEQYSPVGNVKTALSDDDSITTLVSDSAFTTIVRHTSGGVLDETFSDDGVLIAAQSSYPVGIALNQNGSVTIAVIQAGEHPDELTMMKFESDGSPSIDFRGASLPPGVSQLKICPPANCVINRPAFFDNLIRASDGHLLIGLSVYYKYSDATRLVAVRVNENTGAPDPYFGDTDEYAFAGVGRSIAVPSNYTNFYSSAIRGDRLTLVATQTTPPRIIATGFLGDHLMSDGFE